VASARVNDELAWEVEGAVRVRGKRSTPLRGVPRLTFLGESGRSKSARWATIEVTKGGKAVDGVMAIDASATTARFKAVTDPASHPVPADRAAVTLAFHVEPTEV
jgi:hypothetical protein